jgi:hypothetical protein
MKTTDRITLTARLECTSGVEMKHAVVNAVRSEEVRPGQSKYVIYGCFSCGRSFVYHGPKPDGSSGRFCSDRCREWYDAGNPPYEPHDPRKLYSARATLGVGLNPGYLPAPMRVGPVGFFIRCLNCGKEFESKGLRCCSTECEQMYREREENAKLMAAVGMEPDAKRRCLECGAIIPRWRKGRRVRSDIQFCCSQHKKKYLRRIADSGPKTAKLASECQTTFLGTNNAKEVPILHGSGTTAEKTRDPPPVNMIGRYRSPGAPDLDANPHPLPENVVRDADYPGMYRVRRSDGSLSDMMNLTRAKEAARYDESDLAIEDPIREAA